LSAQGWTQFDILRLSEHLMESEMLNNRCLFRCCRL